MIGIFPFCRNESTKQEMELQAKLLEFHTKNGLDVDLRKIAYIAEKLLPENIGYALSGNLLFFSEDFIKSEKSTNNWWLALESNLLSMPSIISKILRPEEMAVLLIKG